METRSKNLEIADEAQQRFDPLQNALKEYLLQELMFQHFTGNEVKQIFEVSTLWNEIASESKKCGEKLKLTIRTNDKAEKLTEIKASGRKYATVQLQSNEGNQGFNETLPLLLDIVKSIGWNLKEFRVTCPIKIEILAQMLTPLSNLETLSLRGTVSTSGAEVTALLQIPKLKKLNCTSLKCQILKLFGNVKTLETFQSIDENVDMELLEDFILRQDKLKNLLIYISSEENLQKLFADKKRLKEMKFQLETIRLAAYMIHSNSAVEFFRRQQRSLKVVELVHDPTILGGTPEEHCQVMRSILTLPNLETLKIISNNFTFHEDLIDFVRNAKVKLLELFAVSDKISIGGDLVEMFPNLQKIQVMSRSSENNLHLINFCCEKLPLIQCKNVTSVVYHPPFIDFDQIFFETKLEEFLLNSSINKLHIGRIQWITADIKLSLGFWENILQKLPALNILIITHPGNLIDLVNLLKTTDHSFEKVLIFTNNIGTESTNDIALPSSVDIIEVFGV
jgi:hypothetical protein